MSKKKYVGIAKVCENGVTKFVKYHFNFIENFINWLTKKYDVFYLNIYFDRIIFATWGKNKGLVYN